MSAPDPSVDVVESRNAAWVFRCHRCDRTKMNLTEDAARHLAAEHVHDDQAPAPWRFDVPEVPDSVTAIKDSAGDVWLLVRPGRWADAERVVRGAAYSDHDLVELLECPPLVECEDPRGTG